MKRASALFILTLLVCLAIVLSWGRFLQHEIEALKDEIFEEASSRTQGDALILERMDDSLESLLMQLGSMDKEVRKIAGQQDVEARLPKAYVDQIRFYIRNHIDDLVNQQPVFGAEWEILSIRFYSPDLISVRCKDGDIEGTLLVLVYPEDKETYGGEVVFSDIKPWAG